MALSRAKQILSQLVREVRDDHQQPSEGLSIRQLSLLHGPTEPTLLNLTLGQLLDREAKIHGDRESCVSPATGARLSYSDLSDQSKLLARGLLSLGIKKGDHIGILAGNCERYIILFIACARVGAILAVLNCTYTISEAENAVSYSDCKILFTSETIGVKDNAQLVRAMLDKVSSKSSGVNPEIQLALDLVCLMRTPSRGIFEGSSTFDEILWKGQMVTESQLAEREIDVSCYDVCNLQFTSGTTGSPKAAMLTHHNIVNNGLFIGDRMGLTERDILCCPPPLFHCFGLVLGLLACITHGSCIVLPSAAFSPKATLAAVSAEKCTALHGVPAMFVAELEQTRQADFDYSSLRTGIAAGSPVPPSLMKSIRSEFNLEELTNTYGMTETSPAVFMTSTKDTLDRRLTTVGSIMPHTSVKVIDCDGRVVLRGQPGELCVAGYLLQKGYYKNQAKTDEIMVHDSDGVLWLHTGDEVIIDEDGYCRVIGRIKDMIIRGGENIYPQEIENRLLEHPAISQASVIGVAHERLGEVVGAFLQKREGFSKIHVDEIRAFVSEKLASHKCPVHLFWLGDNGVGHALPATGSGKVKKIELRDIAHKLVKQGDNKTP